MIFKNSLIVFFFTLAGSSINYLYHLITGRLLSPAQYGLLESFIALSYFIAVLTSTFSLSVIKQVNTTKIKKLPVLFSSLTRLSIKLTIISWLIFLSLYPFFKKLLHLENPTIFIIFSLQILFAFLPTLYSSIIQAKLKFFTLGFLSLISPLIKIILTLILILLGWKLTGAITGPVLAGLITSFASYLIIKKLLNLRPTPPIKLPANFWRFSSLAFISQLALTSLYATDILLVRHFFSPQLTGLYSAVSTTGKTIFFLSSIILVVSFPVFSLVAKIPSKLKTSFIQALLLVCLIGSIGLIGFNLFPQLAIQALYGSNYGSAIIFLPAFAVFMFAFSLFNLVNQFLLNIHHLSSALIPATTALLQISLIIFNHQNLITVIKNSILAVTIGLFFSLYFAIKHLYASQK